MARLSKELVLKLSARVPTGEDGIWAIIHRIDAKRGNWTISDVDRELNMSRGSVHSYVLRLARGGFVFCTGSIPSADRKSRQNIYRLASGAPREAPRLKWNGKPAGPVPAQLMWRAMRTLRDFTIAELAFAASTDTYRVSRKAAIDYARLLAGAGYLQQRDAERYRLVPSMNTGPHYPLRVEVGVVFDRNKMEYVGVGEVLR